MRQATTVNKASARLRHPLHVKARSQHPAYPARAEVDDKDVHWNQHAGDYTAVEFTHAVVLKNDSTKPREGGNNGQATHAETARRPAQR